MFDKPGQLMEKRDGRSRQKERLMFHLPGKKEKSTRYFIKNIVDGRNKVRMAPNAPNTPNAPYASRRVCKCNPGRAIDAKVGEEL